VGQRRVDEVECLEKKVEHLETALRCARREMLDARGRLALIARILRDRERVQRAPGVTFGAIDAVLFAETPTLQRVERRYRD